MASHGGGPPPEVRRDRILQTVRDHGFSRVTDLSAAFNVSEVTVRSDLAALEEIGELRRVRGGATPHRRPSPETPFEQSTTAHAGEKARIGAAAASLVDSGDTVLLDVGSTAAEAAKALARRDDLADVVVLTNGLNIALALEAAGPRITVVVTGGTLRPLQHSLVNPLASLVLSRVNADLALLGCNGVHPAAGVTNVNLPEAEVKRQMIASAERVIVLADTSKIGQTSLAHLCDIACVDLLVTGRGLAPDTRSSIESAGTSVRGV